MKIFKSNFFLLLFFICIFLTFNKHSKDKEHSYHDVIWADAAGYYIHSPIWFIYGNDASKFPKEIAEETGNGFYVDSLTNKVVTKYPCGVAILQTPFFLISHLLATPLGFESNGFSKIYSYGIYFSGIFYACMGMWLLSMFLQKHFSPTLSVLTPLILFSSTNLFYYTIDAPGMSHIYSFFLFALFIYSAQKLFTSDKQIHYLGFVASLALLVIIRPTNMLIILFPLFYERGLFYFRFKSLLKNRIKVLAALSLGFLLIIPQLIYWKTTFGKWIIYTYGNETFSNWSHPKLIQTWFSPNNGLFIYAPVLLLAIWGIFMMVRKKHLLGNFLAILFLLISYIFSSWWCWWFGCSFGARSFVEFYVLLSIPFAYFIEFAFKKKFTKYLTIIFIVFFSIQYFNIEYYYDGCFYGNTWDWSSYLKLLDL